PALGDVAREPHRAHDFALAPQRKDAELKYLARRPVELDLAFRGTAGERVVQQLVQRVLREHFTRARAGKAARDRVADDLAADAVDHNDRVGRLVERGE